MGNEDGRATGPSVAESAPGRRRTAPRPLHAMGGGDALPAPRLHAWLDARGWALLAVMACTLLVVALDPGIQVGRENHAGLLPVVRRLLDPGYLPGDFGISIRLHHHRVFAAVVAALSALVGENRALALLALSGYALVFAALWRVAGSLQLPPRRQLLVCVALATSFAFLDHGVEANRFLGNGPIMPPTFAHALVLLGIDAILRGRWNIAFALAGAVALVHLQIGGIWWLVLAATLPRFGPWRRPSQWLPGVAVGVLVASPALHDLWQLADSGLTRGIATMQDVALRMPQHFQFHGNRVAAVAAYLGVFAWLWWRWRRDGDARATTHAPLLWIASLLMAITALHYLDYYVLQTGWIARIQLLRLSVFVPVLAALAIAATRLPAPGTRERWPLWTALVFALGALAGQAASDEPPSLRIHDAAQAPTTWNEACGWVGRAGPRTLYVTPPGKTGFTACSHRSTVVEFKVNPDGGAGLVEWQQRLLAVAGGTLPPGSTRADVAAALDAAYARLDDAGFAALAARYGAGAAIVPATSPLRGRVLHANADYRVVALAPATR